MAKRRQSADEGTPLLEWLASSLGAAFALAIMGFVLWEGITGRDVPASIRVEIARGYAVANGYALDFEAVNDGGEPAADVRVGAGGDRIVTFDFVPAHSRRKGTFVLDTAPDGPPDIRVLGYREP